MSSWNERVGITEHIGGFVVVGFHCSRCEAYAELEMPMDDYNADKMKGERCSYCAMRNRLANEIRNYRSMKKTSLEFIRSMEQQLNVLTSERGNYENLLEGGTRIINQQDMIIRDLKKQLDRKKKKR